MALLRYTALRIALFLGTAIVLYALGVKDVFVCALIGILVSGLVSLVLLRNVRSQIGVRKDKEPKGPWKSPLGRISDRMDQAAAAEDAADDAARAEREQS
ncbi:MAG: DUF4229 domain-containing protein [Actinomycetes bacterium]